MDKHAFWDAVKQGKTDELRAALQADPGLVTLKNENGLRPIMVALYYGQDDVVDLLRPLMVELNIWEASALGDVKQLKALSMGNWRLLDALSPDGFPPVGLAAFFGQLDALAWLAETGADVNKPTDNPMRVRPIHSAAAHHDQVKAVAMTRKLLEHGAEVNTTQHGGWTPLHAAVENGNLALARLLLEAGAKIDVKLEDGRTPLVMAESKGFAEIIDLLQAS